MPAPPSDRWIRPLAYGAVAAAVLAAVLFAIYHFSLSSAVSTLQQVALNTVGR
jgi:hypothetical protein